MFHYLKTVWNRFNSGNERTLKVKKNIIASIFLKGCGILISLLLVPITIGYVSPELYGVWLTLSSIMTWLAFFDIGFTQGLKNKLTEAIALEDWNTGKRLVSTTYIMMVVIFIPVCLILQSLVPLINWTSLLNINAIYENDIKSVMSVMIFFFCLQMILNVIVSVVAAFQKVALSSSFNIIGQFLALVLIVILKKLIPGSLMTLTLVLSTMPLIVTITATVVLFTGKFKKLSPSFKCFDRQIVSKIFDLGYKFFIINMQVVVMYQSTNILISHLSSPLEVTTYNIAYKYMNISMMLYTIITAPLWPAYTDAYIKKDFAWMIGVRKKMVKILLLSMLLCVVMVAVSNPVYHLWIGNEVSIPLLMTLLVALYVCIFSWVNLNSTLIVGMGIVKLETIVVMFGMCLHIPLSLFLGKHVGAYGVLISMILINLLYALIFNIQVNKVLNRTAEGIWIK